MTAPIIGVSGMSSESRSVQAMMQRVRDIGAIPLLLANHAKRSAKTDAQKFDAAIIMGNNFDVDPDDYIHRYPENDPRRSIHPKTKSVANTPESAARAVYEKQLITETLAIKMPLFSICGGMQLLNVMRGGTLHQHIPDLLGHSKHAVNAGMEASSPVISVDIVPDTMLARIVKDQSLYAPGVPPLISNEGTVNAFHHQSVDLVGEDLIACAYSDSYTTPDGKEARLVEAIEADPKGKYQDQFVLGVQWHPEFLPDNPTSERMLQDVKQAAIHYAKTHGTQHAPEQAKMENILSSLPILKGISEFTTNQNSTAPTKPKGQTR
jgi:gamma-glutamyl-gamma-aminobutyrate hydrolase PuuD